MDQAASSESSHQPKVEQFVGIKKKKALKVVVDYNPKYKISMSPS